MRPALPTAAWLAPVAALLLWLLGAAFPARAAVLNVPPGEAEVSLAPYVEVLEDPAGELSVNDVLSPENSARFRALGSRQDINFGYSASAFWLRFSLRSATPDLHLLEIPFPTLDRVDLYAPGPDGLTRQQVGDLQPFTRRAVPHRNFVFRLPLAADTVHTYYLRVESQGSLTVPLRLWQHDAFAAHTQANYAALFLYFGALLALGLYNLLLFLSLRDPAYLAYVAFVAAMAVGQLSLNGLGNQFLWPEWPRWGNAAYSSGFAATGFFGALFTKLFLDTRRTARALDWVIVLHMAAFFVAAVGPALFAYRDAAILTSLTGVSFAAVATIGGVLCLRRGHPGAPYFLLAWGLLLLGVAVLGLRNLGWLPTTFLTTYAMQIGSGLEMLLLSFALANRIQQVLQDKERAQADTLAIQTRMVDALQRSEQELEQRVHARTVELEQANERLREQEQILAQLAHRDALTGLANRVVLDDRLAHALERAQRDEQQLAVLLLDLDGFKPINDRHGHATGDRVLAQVARRLENAVRSSDTVARVGGDEFVILLEGLTDLGKAEAIAAKVIQALAEPLAVDEFSFTLGTSIGIACFPNHSKDPDGLMARADQAMYAAKRGGGQCWRVADDLAPRDPLEQED